MAPNPPSSWTVIKDLRWLWYLIKTCMLSRFQSLVSHNQLHRHEAKKSFYKSQHLVSCFHFVALGCFSPCLCTVQISFSCPPYELKHIDLGVQHGSVKEACSIYAFAFIAINHRSLVCEVKFEIKCSALRSNAFWFKNKSITNKYIKGEPKYWSIPLFSLLPWTYKKNEADQHNPRRRCKKCKHVKLKLLGSSLAVELLSLLLSSGSLSLLSSLENSCTSMSDKSASTFTSLKLELFLLSSSEPKIALIRRRPYW